jgi:GMP synthase-like glutamine amidotransferase
VGLGSAVSAYDAGGFHAINVMTEERALRIHALQHVPFEGLGHIAPWITAQGHHLTRTRLYAGEALPSPKDFDRLIIMGGPMNIYEDEQYPWLIREKALINQAIDAGKSLVGICLGAQLLADALGSPVFAGPEKEIGWWPISLTTAGKNCELLRGLPDRATVFHWHGDTFDLPQGAVHLAESAACGQQAFLFDNRILGLQFHLESTPATVGEILTHCGHELGSGRYVQTEAEIFAASPERFQQINSLMETLLTRLP